MAKKKIITSLFGILAGLIAYGVTGKIGLYVLQCSWASYALHAKDKSYTLAMLLSRLLIGIVAALIAGIVTAKIERKSAWMVGGIVFCVASYIHLVIVWTQYPVWYHVAYLLPIIPLTGLGHYIFLKNERDRKNKIG